MSMTDDLRVEGKGGEGDLFIPPSFLTAIDSEAIPTSSNTG
jgi:hypothetical protein